MIQRFLIILILLLSFYSLRAQDSLTKKELKSILKETLKKSRNAVKTASNSWRYDNTNSDYFKKDTISLNAARTYRQDYCNGIFWSFYQRNKFILEDTRHCNEPPLKIKTKREDSITLKIKRSRHDLILELININGVFQKFEVVDIQKNKPLSDEGNYQFDYTMILRRINL